MTVADNAQKVPFIYAMNAFATQKALDAINLLGKALPASIVSITGSIVTVKFEVNAGQQQLPNITIPKLESQWLRAPTQVGDKGMVVPCDLYLGGMSGLGGGVADLTQPSNLGALAWIPVSNSSWSAPSDPNKAFVNGPDGVIIQDENGNTIITVDKTTGVTIKVPLGMSVTINTLPISAAGLLSGALWNSGGTVKVVP